MTWIEAEYETAEGRWRKIKIKIVGYNSFHRSPVIKLKEGKEEWKMEMFYYRHYNYWTGLLAKEVKDEIIVKAALLWKFKFRKEEWEKFRREALKLLKVI